MWQAVMPQSPYIMVTMDPKGSKIVDPRKVLESSRIGTQLIYRTGREERIYELAAVLCSDSGKCIRVRRNKPWKRWDGVEWSTQQPLEVLDNFRATTLIYEWVPPRQAQIEHLLRNGMLFCQLLNLLTACYFGHSIYKIQ